MTKSYAYDIVATVKAKANERGDKMKLDPAKLAEELTRQHLTQKELAEKAGISRVTVSNIKCGKTCTDAIGNAIAEALGVDVKELLEVKPGE